MRRFEKAYRIKRGDNLGEEKLWNDRFLDIDLRLAASEDALANVDEVANRVESVALDRINNVITPLVIQTQERIASIPDLFTATSISEVAVGEGPRTFVIEASMRSTFAVGAYMQAARIADGDVWLAGALVSYDPATGALVLNIDQFDGGGTHSDWRIRTTGRRGKTGETGPTGLRFIAGGYNPATAYIKGDAIRYSGKVWRAKVDTTGNAPPLAGESNTWWDLLVVDGADPVAIERSYSETVADAPKTVFTIPGGYDPASVLVWVNGVKLMPEDYTATNGTTAVLTDAAQIGDTFEFVSFSAFSLVDTFNKAQNFADVADKAAARTNLGLGTAATADVEDIEGDIQTWVDEQIGDAKTEVKAWATANPVLPRGWISGLDLSNSGSAPNTVIDVAAGICRDDTDTVNISLDATTIDFTTVGAGGVDSGGDGWYHCFAIAKADGTTATFASKSLTPTLPSGYVYKRMIHSVLASGGALVGFEQDGDMMRWKAPTLDADVGISSASERLITTRTPPYRVVARVAARVYASGAAVAAHLYEVGKQPPLYNIIAEVNNIGGGGNYDLMTDASKQIACLGNGSGAVMVSTLGWTFRRMR